MSPLKMSESPGFGEALSAFCQKVKNLKCKPLFVTESSKEDEETYGQPEGIVPTADAK